MSYNSNKNKIINDPLYGFIRVSDELIYSLINHPYFQRLRRIKQLGLSDMVYPGAVHTRFHHALGAMHLAQNAVESLRAKKVEISEEEKQALQIALLLHDIGHGPFSHTLEHTLLSNVSHEFISLGLMKILNKSHNQQLRLAIKMFCNQYERTFFHQLISSQLDLDRLDYLKRDSFYTGVVEGIVGSDHILKMIQVHKNELVMEEKSIYSIENFLNSRRLMYWQVYMHKTAVAAEKMLIKIIKRSKELAQFGQLKVYDPAFEMFLKNDFTTHDFEENPTLFDTFTLLDDSIIYFHVKQWVQCADKVLSTLCQQMMNRQLFKIQTSLYPINEHQIAQIEEKIEHRFKITDQTKSYFYDSGLLKNYAYLPEGEQINILTKSGAIRDLAEAADLPNIKAMKKMVKKYYLCWPKSL